MLDGAAHKTLTGFGVADEGTQSGQLPLIVRGLILELEGKRLLDGIDLTIEEKGFTAIMGPNGAGKSMFLRLLHGLIPATAGSILWGYQPVGEATRKRQAMVFQQPVLLRRSVAANIDFVLELRGAALRDRRDEILDQVGLLDKVRQPARRLSGGEQQRLALARALAVKPYVLFLDEPTASLDPASVLMIEQIVAQLHETGTKVIFVTHDLGQAKRLADEVVFLHRGKLMEQAPAREFFARPASQAAKAYLEGRLVL